MTVATLVSTVSYIGNGVSTAYTYPFYLIDAGHLQAWVNGLLQPVSAYTVTSIGNQFGGEVIFNVAPLNGQSITLRRSVPATQLVDYRPYDPFPAEVHEQALDKLTMIVQGNEGFISNAVRAPLLEPVGSSNLVLPAASVRANFLLGFDGTGNVTTYPFVGLPPVGITDHGQLTGLADDDHPQYMLRADLAGSFLPLSGGTLTGALQLPFGFPTSATEAVNKAYVDTFIGSVITKNIISDVNGDSQGTVEGGWNTQANAAGITRASNEIIYYRWKSTDTVVYRYVGSHQGPAGWNTVAKDWAAASGVNEAPLDGFTYGRKAATWAQVVERSGGSYTGKVQGFAGPAAAADLARTDEVQAISSGAIALHNSALDPHPQYLLKAGGVISGPALFADGTVAAPGIAWANEPTMGWYRPSANQYFYAVGGIATQALVAQPADTSFSLFPRTVGQAVLSLNSAVYGSSSGHQLNLFTNQTGHSLTEFLFGGAAARPMSINFPAGITVTGPTTYNNSVGVAGAGTFNTTLAVGGAATFNATLSVGGNAGVGGSLNVTGSINSGPITSTGRITAGEHFTTVNSVFAGAFNFNNPASTGWFWDSGTAIYFRLSGANHYYASPTDFKHFTNVSMNGTLTVDGVITANSTLNVAGAIASGGQVSSTIFAVAGATPSQWWQDASYVYFQNAGSWYWSWSKSSGYLAWNTPAGVGLAVDANKHVFSGANLYAASDVYTINGSGLAMIGSNTAFPHLRFSSDGWRLQWAVATGNLTYVSAGGSNLVTFDGTGNIGAAGAIAAGGAFSTPSSYNTSGANGINFTNSGITTLNIAIGNPAISAFFISFVHVPGTWAGTRITCGGGEFRFDIGGSAQKSDGTTTWGTISDERLKKDIAPLTYGLREVLLLEPITFVMKRADTAFGVKVRAGITAQNLQQVMPQMITKTPDEEFGEVLGMEGDYIQFAMVNAIKELNARLTALENA